MSASDTVRATFAEARKPFYASLAVTGLAVAKARELPAVTLAEMTRVQAQVKALPEQMRSLPAQVRALPAQVQSQVAQLSGTVQELRGSVGALPDRATNLYGDLVVRGEHLLSTLRRQDDLPAPTVVKSARTRVRRPRTGSDEGTTSNS